MNTEELREAPLPVESINEALLHLRRPFTAAAVKWKVQTAWQGGGMVVAYIDARLVMERLNRVVGGAWEQRYEVAGEGLMWCHLTVLGVTRSDMGAGQGAAGGMQKKATVSDALKRAGVPFGIGVSIYAMSRAVMNAGTSPTGHDLKAKKKMVQGKEKWTAELTPGAEEWLREKYGAWLKAKGEPMFGPELDHGDEVGAQGADDEPSGAPEVAEEQTVGEPVVRDEKAAELHDQIEAVYKEIRKMNAAAKPPATFKAERDAASSSHEALEGYLAELTRILDEMKAARS